MKSEPECVDAYLGALPDDKRPALERVRAVVRCSKNHLSFFPASGTAQDKLGAEMGRHFSGRGTIRFTPETPIADDVIEQIVRIRLDEHSATP